MPLNRENIIGRCLALFAQGVTGAQAIVKGFEQPDEPCVYYANHTSHGDFLLLWASLSAPQRERTRPIAGKDYWATSPLKFYIGERVFRALLVDRSALRDIHGFIQTMADALDNGDSLIIFPEGTRNLTDSPLLDFKAGIYHLAQTRPQTPFVPVWINNISRVLPKGKWLPVPLLCTLLYGKPFTCPPDEEKANFLQRAQSALLALSENDGDSDNNQEGFNADIERADKEQADTRLGEKNARVK